jgi:hypothetical protein
VKRVTRKPQADEPRLSQELHHSEWAGALKDEHWLLLTREREDENHLEQNTR